MSERSRLANKKVQILNVLRNAGKHGVTNAELSKIALRYGGHLGKLYEEGYKIDKLSLGNGLYCYTLISEPETIVTRERAFEKLLEEIGKIGFINKDELVELLDANNITVKYKANTYKQEV